MAVSGWLTHSRGQVDRFAGEWVPPGGVKVPSMLKVTPLAADAAPPQAAFHAEEASRLREPEAGLEGVSLEQALEGAAREAALLACCLLLAGGGLALLTIME